MKGITFSQEKSKFGYLVFLKDGNQWAEACHAEPKMVDISEWYLDVFLAETDNDKRCVLLVEVMNALKNADNGLAHIKDLLPLPETISKSYKLKFKRALDEAFKINERKAGDREAMRVRAMWMDFVGIPPAARNEALAWAYGLDVSTVKRYLGKRGKISSLI
jgi:hypothetical protein